MPFRLFPISVFILAFSISSPLTSQANNQSPDRDGGKQSEIALNGAETAFDTARQAYDKGSIDKGDAALDDMTKDLDACVVSLQSAHKSRFYKKAELRVAMLQRRMKTLLDDIDLQSRGWAEQTDRKLEEVHEKILAGAMRK